jgi:hypothetical protein
LVAQWYCQKEGIDYEDTFAHVARLEAIRILLAFGALEVFKLFQMHVKRAFVNGYIDEDIYVRQPLVLKFPSFQTMFLNSKNLCMV